MFVNAKVLWNGTLDSWSVILDCACGLWGTRFPITLCIGRGVIRPCWMALDEEDLECVLRGANGVLDALMRLTGVEGTCEIALESWFGKSLILFCCGTRVCRSSAC